MMIQSVSSVLFVCLGNICRSPAAEIIFRNLLERAGLSDVIRVDSAGTMGYHEDSLPDSRMIAALGRHGFNVYSTYSRPLHPEDFIRYDLILGMDNENLHDIKRLAPDSIAKAKVAPMCQFVDTNKFRDREVPDPYYGDPRDFDHVVELLDHACSNLIKAIVPNQ